MNIELLYILGAIASVITALPLLFAFLKKCLEICKIAIKLFHTAIKSFFTKNIDAIRTGGFFGVFFGVFFGYINSWCLRQEQVDTVSRIEIAELVTVISVAIFSVIFSLIIFMAEQNKKDRL